MSRTAAKRYWNPVGMVFAAVFLSGGTLFAGVAAVSAGWIQPPAGAPTDIGFGPRAAISGSPSRPTTSESAESSAASVSDVSAA